LAKGNLTLDDVEAAKERAIGRGEFKEVDHWRKYAPETRYTTPELQAKEHKMLTWMDRGRAAVRRMPALLRAMSSARNSAPN
jgi:hypothetical protein